MKHQARNAAKKNLLTSNKIAPATIAGPAAKRLATKVARHKKPRKLSKNNAVTAAVLETLETRQFLSATMNVVDGMLVLRADAQTPSRVIVHLSQDGQQVVASINGQDQSFDLKNLKGVQVTGSNQADTIRVSSRLTLPTTLQGGAGDDRIYGGGGNDHIDAGAGNDYANGRAGNDSILGGDGNDTLVGGRGDDTLDGGAGNDRLYGRNGPDSLDGGTGSDMLWGGEGNDTLDGSAGTDVVNGQAGRNRIVRGANDKVRARRSDVVVSSGNTTKTPSPTPPVVGAANSGTPSTSTGGTSSGSGSSNTGTSGGSSNGSTSSNNGSSSTPTGGGSSTGTTSNTGSTGSGTTGTGTTGTGSTGGTASNPGSDPAVGGGTSTGSNSSGSADIQGSTGNIGLDRTTGTLKGDIQFIEATGMAGHAVHVNALGSTLSAGDAMSTTYSWDFGDAGSRFNTLVGWTAGHIYDKPGSYTVTLTVTDSSGKSTTTTAPVTITANTRNVIYVDQNGSDANSGATPGAAVASLARAAALADADTTILFHNGQTFDVADTFNITHSNVTISTYGSGAAARLRKIKGNGSSILNVNQGANDVVVEGIVFDSMWTIEQFGDQKVNVRGIWVTGDNFSVRNCEFYNVDDAICTAGMPTGVMVQDNYFGMSIRGNCIWGQGFDHVYIGNTFTNSTQEHLIRCSDTGVTRLLVENNDFSRPDNNKGSLELRTAQWFYVRGNRIDGGTLRLGLPNGVLPDGDAVAYGVVEGNETFGVFVNIRPGASHISFRDNVIHYDDGVAIVVETKYADVQRLTQDLRFDHNTVVSASQKATFLELDGAAKDISITNNLMVAPNILWLGSEAAAVYVAGTDLSSFSRIDDNIWPQIPDGTKQAGANYLFPTLYDYNHGYVTNQKWQTFSQVHDEQYDNADLSGDEYSLTLNGVTAGATPDLFNTNAYKVAVKQAA